MTKKKRQARTILEKYPPSAPCSCEICLGYCRRPGWWTVEEAIKAIEAGYGNRMMLEIAPELNFGVLSPAFKGCEGGLALNVYANYGCNFLQDGLCELHSTGLMPCECRFCHHERVGMGEQCHLDLEKEWRKPGAQELIKRWGATLGLWERLKTLL